MKTITLNLKFPLNTCSIIVWLQKKIIKFEVRWKRTKLRTKMRLKFYLSLISLVLFTIIMGVLIEYIVWNVWQMRLGFKSTISYEYIWAGGIILFIMSIVDIFLFFHLILKRRYW